LTDRSVFVFLPGSGGAAPHLEAFGADGKNQTRFVTIGYPGWRRYIGASFSAHALITELAEQIVKAVPDGPIRIVGNSIGGHFGYAAALHLQAAGREISGFCAIDSFMFNSSDAAAGWHKRALAHGLHLLRRRRFAELMQFGRSKFWRALLRLGGSRVPRMLHRIAARGRTSSLSSIDPLFESEINLRLLTQAAVSWIADLDREPIPLDVPSALLRTRFVAEDDLAWRRRCPKIEIYEIPGGHHTLFDPENIDALRSAFITATARWL
jgi:thioesterase domain-containing protein